MTTEALATATGLPVTGAALLFVGATSSIRRDVTLLTVATV